MTAARRSGIAADRGLFLEFDLVVLVPFRTEIHCGQKGFPRDQGKRARPLNDFGEGRCDTLCAVQHREPVDVLERCRRGGDRFETSE